MSNIEHNEMALSQELDLSCRISKQDAKPPSSPIVTTTTPPMVQKTASISQEENKLIKRDLFGGAMQIGIPSLWRDISNVRQIPDHQEVFQDCATPTNPNNVGCSEGGNSEGYNRDGTDGFIVIEILERQDSVSDNDAAKFFFDDLAEANGSGKVSIDYQNVWSGKRGRHDGAVGHNDLGSSSADVAVHLVPELKAHKACSCIGTQCVDSRKSFDDSRKSAEEKSSRIRVELCAIRLEEVQTDLLVTLTIPITVGGSVRQKGAEGHSELFRKVMSRFIVNDWSLFC